MSRLEGPNPVTMLQFQHDCIFLQPDSSLSMIVTRAVEENDHLVIRATDRIPSVKICGKRLATKLVFTHGTKRRRQLSIWVMINFFMLGEG